MLNINYAAICKLEFIKFEFENFFLILYYKTWFGLAILSAICVSDGCKW
jgi:hypothetical protein